MAGLRDKAESALYEMIPASLRERILRTEFDTRDATLIAYAGLTETEGSADPLRLLRRNADPAVCGIEAPIVCDPVAARPVRRIVLPHRLWSNAGRMRQNGPEHELDASSTIKHTELRMLKGVPDRAVRHTYGRSGRLNLLFDRPRPLLTAAVFAGGLCESPARLSEANLRQAAWVLLARSGVSTGARSFHLLRAPGFFRVERAVGVPEPIGRECFMMLERDLLSEAEEDHRILSALLRADVAWLRADANPNQDRR